MKHERFPNAEKRVDLTNLLEFTGNNRASVLKYIGIFIKCSAVELISLKAGLIQRNGDLLYGALHILRPQLELMGVNVILPEVRLTEATLQQNKEVTDSIKKSVDIIMTEITLACSELELIQKDYL